MRSHTAYRAKGEQREVAAQHVQQQRAVEQEVTAGLNMKRQEQLCEWEWRGCG